MLSSILRQTFIGSLLGRSSDPPSGALHTTSYYAARGSAILINGDHAILVIRMQAAAFTAFPIAAGTSRLRGQCRKLARLPIHRPRLALSAAGKSFSEG